MITLRKPANIDTIMVNDWCGLSTDTKPSSANSNYPLCNGDRFYEIDTGLYFKYSKDSNQWYEQPSAGGEGVLPSVTQGIKGYFLSNNGSAAIWVQGLTTSDDPLD